MESQNLSQENKIGSSWGATAMDDLCSLPTHTSMCIHLQRTCTRSDITYDSIAFEEPVVSSFLLWVGLTSILLGTLVLWLVLRKKKKLILATLRTLLFYYVIILVKKKGLGKIIGKLMYTTQISFQLGNFYADVSNNTKIFLHWNAYYSQSCNNIW